METWKYVGGLLMLVATLMVSLRAEQSKAWQSNDFTIWIASLRSQ
jgi:hypothetical protein